MNHQEWDGIEPARSRLRALTASVERELERLEQTLRGAGREDEVGALTNKFRELAAALALGAEPVLRNCPHCQRQVLRDATRCRYCLRHSEAAARP